MDEEEREVGWVEVKNIVKKVVTHIALDNTTSFIVEREKEKGYDKNRGWGQRK